jgi:hypothetical protein
MVSDGKTRRRMNQREWECFEDGVNYERDRIIELIKSGKWVGETLSDDITKLITLIGDKLND